MEPQLIANTIYSFLLLAVIASSFFLIFKPSGYFHVSHAATIVAGAYVFLLAQSYVDNLIIAVTAALAGATLFGLANELLLYRPIAHRPDRGIQVLVVSLGVYLIVQNVISAAFGDEIRLLKLCSTCLNSVVAMAGVTLSATQILVSGVATILLLALSGLWYLTDFGRAARSVSENLELAGVIGIDVRRIVLTAVALGSFVAGVSGLLIGLDVGVTPTVGFSFLLYGIIAVIVGGNQSLLGTILGALILAVFQNLTGYFLETKWSPVLMYLLLIAFLLLRPQGASAVGLAVERR